MLLATEVSTLSQTFGFKIDTLEEAVAPVLDQFLELLAKEQAVKN